MTAIGDARTVVAGGERLGRPGHGQTRQRFRTLAERTRADISTGRLLEAHHDADAILRDLGRRGVDDGQFWGVWAAESSAAVLTASKAADGRWTVSGTKPWCSGADGCTHALITARDEVGDRIVFVVEPTHPSVTVRVDDWHNAGMTGTQTHSLDFDATPVEFVADAGEYLHRPGFWHGAVGVAACWFGGAQLVADRLRPQKRSDDLTLLHLGIVDTELWTAATALDAAAASFDANPHDLLLAHAVALRVRAIVERVAGEVVAHVGRCLGPGPLVADAGHAQAVADLTVYLRQSHAEHDLRSLGEMVLAHPAADIGTP